MSYQVLYSCKIFFGLFSKLNIYIGKSVTHKRTVALLIRLLIKSWLTFKYFQGLTFFLAYSIFSAVLGMLQFGYNTGVINAPEQVLTHSHNYPFYFFG